MSLPQTMCEVSSRMLHASLWWCCRCQLRRRDKLHMFEDVDVECLLWEEAEMAKVEQVEVSSGAPSWQALNQPLLRQCRGQPESVEGLLRGDSTFWKAESHWDPVDPSDAVPPLISPRWRMNSVPSPILEHVVEPPSPTELAFEEDCARPVTPPLQCCSQDTDQNGSTMSTLTPLSLSPASTDEPRSPTRDGRQSSLLSLPHTSMVDETFRSPREGRRRQDCEWEAMSRLPVVTSPPQDAVADDPEAARVPLPTQRKLFTSPVKCRASWQVERTREARCFVHRVGSHHIAWPARPPKLELEEQLCRAYDVSVAAFLERHDSAFRAIADHDSHHISCVHEEPPQWPRWKVASFACREAVRNDKHRWQQQVRLERCLAGLPSRDEL